MVRLTVLTHFVIVSTFQVPFPSSKPHNSASSFLRVLLVWLLLTGVRAVEYLLKLFTSRYPANLVGCIHPVPYSHSLPFLLFPIYKRQCPIKVGAIDAAALGRFKK